MKIIVLIQMIVINLNTMKIVQLNNIITVIIMMINIVIKHAEVIILIILTLKIDIFAYHMIIVIKQKIINSDNIHLTIKYV